MPGLEDQNLDPEQFNPEEPGGPAVQPSGGIAQKARDAAAKKVGSKVAGEAAADVATAGTGGVGAVLRPVIKWATEKIVNKLLSKDWWKVILKIYWPQIAAFVLILGFCAIAATIIIRAYKGFWGMGRGNPASIYNEEDISDVDIILGTKYQLSGNPKEWYFSQNDPRWANEKLAGWTKGGFSAVGCAITSGAMMMKYYGASNVTPLIFGQYHVEKTGSASMNPDTMVQFLADVGVNKKIVGVPKSLTAIKSELEAGNPILAQGYKTFNSSGQHWVVITGLKGNQLIMNNPSARANDRVDFAPSNIKGLWALHDK